MVTDMDRSTPRRGRAGRIAVIAAVVGLALAAPVGFAQTPEAGMGDALHPAHIHVGTCADIGDVVAPLTDVAAIEGEAMGPSDGLAVLGSHTVVPLPLEAIIEGGHAINVHLSAEEIGTYIACGDIGGVVATDDDGERGLVIGLGELNDSGYVGIAWLGERGEETEVSVNLIAPE
jgi:hypothetical protein